MRSTFAMSAASAGDGRLSGPFRLSGEVGTEAQDVVRFLHFALGYYLSRPVGPVGIEKDWSVGYRFRQNTRTP